MKKLINKLRAAFGLYTSWHYTNIDSSAKIGRRVNIGSYTEIGPEVFIGDDTRIQAHCFIPKGVIIGKLCFIGPRVTFTNDKFPPSTNWQPTLVENGASIGAGSIILPGVTIGEGARIGAGSVVTKNVPAGALAFGVPAQIRKSKPIS